MRLRFLTTLVLVLAAAAAAAQTRKVSIMDMQGFGRALEAMSVQVPAGWTASGEVLWQKPCSASEHYEIIFTAYAPDGRTGFRMLPGHQVHWIEAVPNGLDADLAQMLVAHVASQRNQMETAFRDSNCHVARVTGGQDQLFRALILDKRPDDARVTEDLPYDAGLANYRTMFGGAAGTGMQVSYDARDVTLAYRAEAGPVEESLLFSWYMFESGGPVYGMPSTYTQHVVVDTIRTFWLAPERREADQAKVAAMIKSMQVNPEWQREIDGYFEKLRQQRQADAATRDQQRAQEEAIRDQQHQAFLQMIWQ